MSKSAFRTAVLAAGICLADLAGAAPVSFTDTVDPADVFVTNNKINSPYGFVHDLVDDGFNPLTDTLTGLSLTLRFYDDADHQPDSVTVTLDDSAQGSFAIATGATAAVPYLALLQVSGSLMQEDGLLDVLLTRKKGDFWFLDSTLVANAERNGAAPSAGSPVPEPATGFLIGLALLGAGLVRRPGKAA